MIISDLNHVEVVSEETETTIEGGYYGYYYYGYYSSAGAYAGATAAYGQSNYSSTSTGTYTEPGYASSSSSSGSSSSSYYYYW
jgi:hypothetical protein